MITTKSYIVDVTIEIDETKFTPEFLKEFSEDIIPGIRTIQDHIDHLTWRVAAGSLSSFDDFIEGYGPAKDFGIKIKEVCFDEY